MKLLGTEFEHSKFDTLDGKTTVMWKEIGEAADKTEPFTIRVTREGMSLEGKLGVKVSSETEFKHFAELIGTVMQETRRMRPKLATSLAGH